MNPNENIEEKCPTTACELERACEYAGHCLAPEPQPCPECIRLGDLAEEWVGKCRAQEVRAEKAEAQITTLQAEIAGYREALTPLVEFMENECYDDWAIVKNARQALSNNHTSLLLEVMKAAEGWAVSFTDLAASGTYKDRLEEFNRRSDALYEAIEALKQSKTKEIKGHE